VEHRTRARLSPSESLKGSLTAAYGGIIFYRGNYSPTHLYKGDIVSHPRYDSLLPHFTYISTSFSYWLERWIANVLAGTIFLRRKNHRKGSASTTTERSTQPYSFLDLHCTDSTLYTWEFLFFGSNKKHQPDPWLNIYRRTIAHSHCCIVWSWCVSKTKTSTQPHTVIISRFNRERARHDNKRVVAPVPWGRNVKINQQFVMRHQWAGPRVLKFPTKNIFSSNFMNKKAAYTN